MKRCILITICLLLVFVSPIKKGDVNFDGEVDILDYTYIRLNINGLYDFDGTQRRAADMDNNGVIDINDYDLVRVYILGSD